MYQPTEEAVEFIATYMNENQADALVDIARAAGARDTEQAEVDTMTAEHLVLRVSATGVSREIEVPWPAPLQRREDIRAYLLELQEDARL